MSRQAGIPNRNYPPLTISEALRVPRVIQDEAGSMTVTRLTLADLLQTTPGSSRFRDLVASSRFYGLTTGPKAAKAASKVLRDRRTAKSSKTAAGSALSQVEKGRRKARKR